MSFKRLVRSFRKSEWVLLGYFTYAAALPAFLTNRPHVHLQPLLIALAVWSIYFGLAWTEAQPSYENLVSKIRDWIPIGLTLAGFREMELFLPGQFEHVYESGWIQQDIFLLRDLHLRSAIESAGVLFPAYLEFCYLLVYGLSFFCVSWLYVRRRRHLVDTLFTFYLAGTLGAYAIFPFFPSEPPRLVYPAIEMPLVTTWVRTFNLWILKKGTIHIGVFPSAHASSAFAAAWAMLFINRREKIGWVLLVYAVSVSLATVYGRYHYTVDVGAGLSLSIVTGFLCAWILRRISNWT